MNNDIRILLEFARRSLIPFWVLLSFSGLGVALMTSGNSWGRYLFLFALLSAQGVDFTDQSLNFLPIERKRLNTLIWFYMAFWWILPAMAGTVLPLSILPSRHRPDLFHTVCFDIPPMMFYAFCFFGCLTLHILTAGQYDDSPGKNWMPKVFRRVRIAFLAAYLYVLIFQSSTPLKLAFSGIALALIVVWFTLRDHLIPERPAPAAAKKKPERKRSNAARSDGESSHLAGKSSSRSLWIPVTFKEHIRTFIVFVVCSALTRVVLLIAIPSMSHGTSTFLLVPMLLSEKQSWNYINSLRVYRTLPISFCALYLSGIMPVFYLLFGIFLSHHINVAFTGVGLRPRCFGVNAARLPSSRWRRQSVRCEE